MEDEAEAHRVNDQGEALLERRAITKATRAKRIKESKENEARAERFSSLSTEINGEPGNGEIRSMRGEAAD
jgi:hypothetical protein